MSWSLSDARAWLVALFEEFTDVLVEVDMTPAQLRRTTWVVRRAAALFGWLHGWQLVGSDETDLDRLIDIIDDTVLELEARWEPDVSPQLAGQAEIAPLDRYTRCFDLLDHILPRGVTEGPFGDAIEQLHDLHDEGASTWRKSLVVTSTIFWVSYALVRFGTALPRRGAGRD